MLKRMLSITLAAALALSLLPVCASASDLVRDSGYEEAFQQRIAQIALASPASVVAPLKENERKKLDFNTDWLFISGNDNAAKEQDYNESGAQRVSLPHAREAYDLYEPDIKGLQTIDWYRRHFTLSAEDKGDRVVVDFAGGGQVNRVYVNGALVGEAKGAFTPFSFDITDYVTFGEYDNVIAVQVDSRYHSGEMPPGRDIDFHFFGGLHGNATLTLTDPLRAASVFYYNDDVTYGCAEATVHGWIELENDYLQPCQATVRSIVKDRDGAVVSQVEAETVASNQETTQVKLELAIDDPELWSPDDPCLYTVVTQVWAGDVLVDSQNTQIGLRTLKATSPSASEGYFTLNGQRITVIGGNRHTQAPYLGNSVTDKLSVRDAELLKHDLGINFVRTSHYQTSSAFLDVCDRLGIMVEEEPLGWQDTPGWEQFCYSAEEMVKRDRNHACIVLWSIIPNERNANFPSVEASEERQRVTKELDPSRLTIQEEFQSSTVVADVYGWHDYQNPGQANPFSVPAKANSWFVTEWNTNLGKHFIVPNDSETRKINQVEKDGLKLSQLAGNPRIMGTLKWDLFGYMTPMSAGERGKNLELWRCSGLYGHWRDPLHKTWMGYLLGAQAPNPDDVGEILFINSEWKQDSPKSLTVSTNLDAVELYYGTAGGEELVARLDAPNELTTLENGLFRFDLGQRQWTADSYLLAKGYHANEGSPAKEHKVFASTYPSEKDGASITLHNTIGTLVANGSDAAWLLAELKDKNGQREFYGDDNVAAKILSGPGELVYSAPSPVMADGISGFYLRSAQDSPGKTVIQVSADLGETLNDDDAAITYTGNWTRETNKQDAWQGDYHQTTALGASATITFTGTQLAIYAESQNGRGSANVTIDGAPAGSFSCSNADKYGTIANCRVWKSPVLENGTHTVTVTAKGTINIDRLKVFDGKADVENTITVTTLPDPARRVSCRPDLPDAEQPEEQSLLMLELLLADAEGLDRSMYDPANLVLLDDMVQFAKSVQQLPDPTKAIIGKAVQQLSGVLTTLKELSVSRIQHTDLAQPGQTGVYYYAARSDTWVTSPGSTYAKIGRSPGDYYSITFEGVKIALYSSLNTTHGLANIYLDDTLVAPDVDLSRNPPVELGLIWESSVIDPGTHTVRVEVTGRSGVHTVNNNACVAFTEAIVHKEIDPVQQAKTELAAAMARGDILNRVQYTMDSLDQLDQALMAAESALRDPQIEVGEIEAALAALEQAMAALQPEQHQSNITVTCRDEDKTNVPGTVNKMYFQSNAASDWVLENPDTENKNRYLKKVATGQSPTPYAELAFEGTGIEIFSRCSNSAGCAWSQVVDDSGKEVAGQRNISLYDKNIGSGQSGTRSIYKLSDRPRGRYVLRLYPENKAADENSDKSQTSINFAYAVITTGQGPQKPDTTALATAVADLNNTSLDGKHAQIRSSFAANVIQLVNRSYGLLEGSWPDIHLIDPLPEAVTATRVKAVCDKIADILTAVNQELTVEEIGPLANINVPYGTPLDAVVLPAQVTVISSDQQSEKLPVTWSCANYDGNTPGAYPFEGALTIPEGMTNRKGIKARLVVTVARSQEKLYEIHVAVEGGQVEVAAPSQAVPGSEVSLEIGQLPQNILFDGISAVYTLAEPRGHDMTDPPVVDFPDPSASPDDELDGELVEGAIQEAAKETAEETAGEAVPEPVEELENTSSDKADTEPAEDTAEETTVETGTEAGADPTADVQAKPDARSFDGPVEDTATGPADETPTETGTEISAEPAADVQTVPDAEASAESAMGPDTGPAPNPNEETGEDADTESNGVADEDPSADFNEAPSQEPAEESVTTPSADLIQGFDETVKQAPSVEPLELTEIKEGKLYRFLMPAGPVEITVRLKDAPPGEDDKDDPWEPPTPGTSDDDWSDDDRDEPSVPAPSGPSPAPAPAVSSQRPPESSPESIPPAPSPTPNPEAKPEQGQAATEPNSGATESELEDPKETEESVSLKDETSTQPLAGTAAAVVALAVAGLLLLWYRRKQR